MVVKVMWYSVVIMVVLVWFSVVIVWSSAWCGEGDV